MSSSPDQPFGGAEYPARQNSPPLDYPADPALPPPLYPPAGYPPPYPGVGGYPGYGYPSYPVDPYDPYRPTKPPGTNGKAIAALVTSLTGLMCCGLSSVAGLILGLIAMRETKHTGQDGYGIALAGTIIGGLLVLFFAVYLLVTIVIAASGTQYPS